MIYPPVIKHSTGKFHTSGGPCFFHNQPQMLHVWNIYLQNWAMFRVNVGKYSSTMEHLGAINAGFSGLVSHHVASLGCNNQLGLFLNGTVGGAPVR